MAKDWTDSLRDRLDNYAETPGEEVWMGIAARTGISGRRRFPVWIPALASAAAAIAGVFLAVQHSGPVAEPIAVAEKPADQVSLLSLNDLSTESESIAETSVNTAAQNNPVTMMANFSRKTAYCSMPAGAVEEPEPAVMEETEAEMTGSEPAVRDGMAGKGTEQLSKAASARHDHQESEDVGYSGWTDLEEEASPKRKQGFSLGIGASGSRHTAGSTSQPTALAMGANPLTAGSTGTAWTSTELRNNFSSLTFDQPEVKKEYSHRIPVKIGLSARYNIGRFGFETGLDYSILTSDITTGEEGKTWSRGTQTLQYIGIPLNVSFNLLDKRYVTLYAAAGGELEKCVRGRIKADEHEDGKYLRTTDSRLTIKPLQWSINASAGIQVNILRELGLYVEPGVVHHFGNGSEIRSSYTDRPTDFSLRFGLRYSFGL